MDNPRISIIVAADKNRGIGKTDLGVGRLLWSIPDDLKRFKELTMGHPVIMGRKTFESVLSYLKKPFPGRTSIVITHDPDYKHEGVVITNSITDALKKAKNSPGSDEIFITGGGQIYEQALPFTDRIYLTLVEGEYDADTFFPDYSQFKKVLNKKEMQTTDGLKFTWLTLERELRQVAK